MASCVCMCEADKESYTPNCCAQPFFPDLPSTSNPTRTAMGSETSMDSQSCKTTRRSGLRTQGAPAPQPPARLIMIISVFFLHRQRGLLMRGILEPSSYLISVCGLFLLQGPRLALCSLREKSRKWNKTEKPSWGTGEPLFYGPVIHCNPSCTLGT